MRRIYSKYFILSILAFSNSHFVDASKLRRGDVPQNDEIEDISSEAPEENFVTTSLGRLLSGFPRRKTPPFPLTDSKCGFRLRKQHPGCNRFSNGENPSVFWPTTPPGTPTQDASPTITTIPLTPPPTTRPTPAPTLQPSIRPTEIKDRPMNCVQTVQGNELTIQHTSRFYKGDVHCLFHQGQEAFFGYTWEGRFGLFVNGQSVWEVPPEPIQDVWRYTFQGDGNLVMRTEGDKVIWMSGSCCYSGSQLKVSVERVWIEDRSGFQLWSEPFYVTPSPTVSPPPTPPPTRGPTRNPTPGPTRSPTPPPTRPPSEPNTSSGLQYWAYYYPWYHRNNWSRHGYQDEPLLGKYGTNEVGVAEQHIEWAQQAGISTWIVSWWGEDSMAMDHFKRGMMNAPSLNKMKFCMLYESVILDGRGSWRDGSKEEALYQHLKIIRDNFFDHPSYLKINGRPVMIFYITRSRMPYEQGFNGPAVLANMRRRLGRDIYFIADEPFFDWNNKSPDGNENAFKNGQQVFDAYTTYNMFQDSRVRRGETATDYQLREAMPVWNRWAERVPLFPNVMPQYYDFRGHKPLLGNAGDFMRQLREVACLPRTNFNGAPHIMMVTSFNEWWEGTQIEPENGSSDNWNNYGFQFIETLAAFKREVDDRGTYWC